MTQRRLENLALCYQELLTAGERLRSRRQSVPEAGAFRQQIWQGVTAAHNEAVHAGYSPEDTELATFAVVAFLDESILSMPDATVANWASLPLQEERYGHHIAGEVFFQNLQKLLGRADTPILADVLEVYYLAMLLGFTGRYTIGGRGELANLLQQTGDRIRRIRQSPAVISPRWGLPAGEGVARAVDPWVRRLMLAAVVCAVIAVAVFVVYKISLGAGVSGLAALGA